MTTIYYNSESCGIATAATMGMMDPQKIEEGRVAKRYKVYTAITGLIQVGRKSLNSMTSWRKLSEIKFQQNYPENITPALKKQCFQGYWCLSMGYLPGSPTTFCLPTTYKGVVSEGMGNTQNHNFNNNKHLEERNHNA